MTLDKEEELEVSIQVRNMVSNCFPFIWNEWNNVLVSFIHTLTLLCVFSQLTDMPELALKISHHVNHTSN